MVPSTSHPPRPLPPLRFLVNRIFLLRNMRADDINLPTLCSIPIEERPWLEACLVRGAVFVDGKASTEQAVVQLTPPGLTAENVYNPSFDVTPAELISAIVTEKGVATRNASGVFDLSTVV